jgi:hypothetical protein
MFAWVAGQTFADVIGMNAMESCLIGLVFFSAVSYSCNKI